MLASMPLAFVTHNMEVYRNPMIGGPNLDVEFTQANSG